MLVKKKEIVFKSVILPEDRKNLRLFEIAFELLF